MSQVADLGTLLATVATMIAVYSSWKVAVTGPLATASVFLAGFRRLFNPGSNWLRVAGAHRELEKAIIYYELTPKSQRTDAVRRTFVDAITKIVDEEHMQWRMMQQSAFAETYRLDHELNDQHRGNTH